MKDNNLERRLKAIQELKEQHYIGSQEALKYLKSVEALYERPILLSEAINTEIQSKRPLRYPATPERIIGLIDTLDKYIHDEDNNEHSKAKKSGRLNEYHIWEISREITPLFTNSYEIAIANEEDFLEVQDNLYQLFSSFQYKGITDQEFGIEASQSILEEQEFFFKESKNGVLEKLTGVDWNHILSKENLRKIETETAYALMLNASGLYERMRRVLNDNAHSKRETVVKTLSDYAEICLRVTNERTHEEILKGNVERAKDCLSSFEYHLKLGKPNKEYLCYEIDNIENYLCLTYLIMENERLFRKLLNN